MNTNNDRLFDQYKDDITIFYQGRKIIYNEKIPQEETKQKPDIIYTKKPNKLYTIWIVDPDAPSPKNPTKRYYLHLLIINQTQKEEGDIINSYVSPSPPKGSGVHRYYTCVLEQEYRIIGLNEFARSNFNIGKFSRDNKLKLIGCTKFMVEG